jgi:hypothetical protein
MDYLELKDIYSKGSSGFTGSAISDTFITGTNFEASVNRRQNKATPADVSAYSTQVAV